jgi:large subunit ribosomal protein L15
MGLNNLSPAPNSRKSRKRLGRGQGSGLGKTSGKGVKGQKARKSGPVRPGFEGGQMPLYRRLPKRGFTNGMFRKEWHVINVGDLEGLAAGSVVDIAFLRETGVVKNGQDFEGLKVLGSGDVAVALTVRAGKFSATAAAKIKAAGGTAEVV